MLGTRVTDVGLRHLEGLSRLETLSLARTQVSDMGLRHLEGLSRLRCLDLEGTQASDTGLVRLYGLGELQTLYLGRTRVTEAGTERLQAKLPRLKILRPGGAVAAILGIVGFLVWGVDTPETAERWVPWAPMKMPFPRPVAGRPTA